MAGQSLGHFFLPRAPARYWTARPADISRLTKKQGATNMVITEWVTPKKKLPGRNNILSMDG